MPSTTVHLLNDDGTASMATALLMSHHAFRRDGTASMATALLMSHHAFRRDIALFGIFPGLRKEHAGLVATFDELSAQHRRIDPLLQRGDEAFAELGMKAAQAASVVGDLAALLDQHLALEEAHVPAFLRGAKEFPAPPGDAEAAMYAQGFAWSSRGVSAQVLERLDVILPPALKTRLPAARVAFEERCARVWGPTPPGASRTTIPDWLPGGA